MDKSLLIGTCTNGLDSHGQILIGISTAGLDSHGRIIFYWNFYRWTSIHMGHVMFRFEFLTLEVIHIDKSNFLPSGRPL